MNRFRVALATVALVAAAATGYSYSTYAKWPSSPVIFYMNPTTPDLTPAAATAAAQFAMNVWNTQGASPFRFQYGGTSSDTSTGYDGRNVVIFRNVANGSTIATTYSWWDSSNRLVDSDIVVWDGTFTFYTGTSGCGAVANGAYLEDILTHELGHALGLNHSTAPDATMYPSYSYCSQELRTLAADDIGGIQSLYGVSSSQTFTAPTISSPAPGATLAGSSQTFAWTAGSGISNYRLTVGTSAGGGDLFDQIVGSSLTATVSGLPTDGRTIYVRLWWQRSSGWEDLDSTYTAALVTSTGTNPSITTPANGSTLSGASQTFTWTPGAGVSSYWLSLGNAPGGRDLFDQNQGANLTATVTGLPTDGRKIYVRLWWVRGGYYEYADSAVTASNGATGGTGGGGGANPAIATPASGSTLGGSSQTFTWTPGIGVSSYWLSLGNAPGGRDLFDQNQGANLTATVTGLPTDGRKIYVRLWWVRNGYYEYADSAITASSGAAGGTGGSGGANPAIATPAIGSTLSGSSQTFTWTAGVGVSSYWLSLGNAPGGRDLFDQNEGTSLTATVTGLPTDGRKIYVRLWWVRNGYYEYVDSAITASNGVTGGTGGTGGINPAIATPASGSTLTGASQTFTWTPGVGVVSYWLSLGNAPGGRDLFDQNEGASLTGTATGLPTDGRTVYVRLWWVRNGYYEYTDSTYKASR